MTKLKFKNIAIDIDGTVLEEGYYPKFGPFRPHAIRVIKKIRQHGGKVVIWTCRTGDQVLECKEILKDAGIEYDKFNEELEETKELFGGDSRKVFCDIYIDDRGIYAAMNGGIDWLEVEKFLFAEGSVECVT